MKLQRFHESLLFWRLNKQAFAFLIGASVAFYLTNQQKANFLSLIFD